LDKAQGSLAIRRRAVLIEIDETFKSASEARKAGDEKAAFRYKQKKDGLDVELANVTGQQIKLDTEI